MSGGTNLRTPGQYRERARVVREQAAGTNHEGIKARFLHIAQNYEMIADLVEGIRASQERLRNSNSDL
jgi:hypothetical protein